MTRKKAGRPESDVARASLGRYGSERRALLACTSMSGAPLPVLLVAGEPGAPAGPLARALGALGVRAAPVEDPPADGARAVAFFCAAPGGGSLGSRLEAAARAAAGAKRVILVAGASPSAEALAAEDALRYLAQRLSASFSVLRLAAEARPEALARRLAALSGARPPAGGRPVVLLTGASGLIGRALASALDERGLAHLDVCRTPPGTSSPFLPCDLSDPSALARLAEFCRPATHVIHLASRISNAKDLASGYREQFAVNVSATLNLLRALPPSVRHFAYASSFTVYGNTRVSRVDEGHPVAPNNVYGLCKLAVERHLEEFGARAGVPVAVLRYTSVYGPGSAPGRAIPAMIARLLAGRPPEVYGAGSARRDYLYVDDACRAALQAALGEAEGVFNVGTGVGTATAELASLLVRLTGASVAPVFVPRELDAQAASSLVYDVGKMRRELGFTPAVSLEEGLLKTIRCCSSRAPERQ